MVVTDKGVEVLTARPGGKAEIPHFMEQLESHKWFWNIHSSIILKPKSLILTLELNENYTFTYLYLLKVGNKW